MPAVPLALDPAATPGVAELARSMRAGLEARRFPPARAPAALPAAAVPDVRPWLELLAAAACPDVRARLGPVAGLLGHPAPAPRGPLRGFLRLLRRAAKKLFNPWLEVQTRFNHGAIESLESCARGQKDFNRAAIDALETSARVLQAQMGQVQAHAQASLQALTVHVNDCLQQLRAEWEGHEARVAALVESRLREVVNRELGPDGEIAAAGLHFDPAVRVELGEEGPRVAWVTERILENIFVQTRLPAPPARLLHLGCSHDTGALEMASLGFQVVGVDLRPLPLGHPNFEMVEGELAELPCPDGAFDVVVARGAVARVGLEGRSRADRAAVAEAVRVLRPGGRLLLTVPYGAAAVTPTHRVYDRTALAELLGELRVLERAFGLRDGEAWAHSTDERSAAGADSWARVSAVALVVAEKP
jgi:SAM-dependent methyltransferase